jgi:hypothetical protein
MAIIAVKYIIVCYHLDKEEELNTFFIIIQAINSHQNKVKVLETSEPTAIKLIEAYRHYKGEEL